MNDPINPSHYKHLPVEAIDIIDAAIEGAPSPQAAAAQSHLLGYALRANQKGQLAIDAGKAEWYAARWIKAIREVEAKAIPASEPPSETQIPQGWRELKHDEVPSVGDKFLVDGGWVTLLSNWTVTYGAAPSRQVYIRKIEPPPKRYRDPTQTDLRDGPIDCEYRDNEDERWRSGLVVYILNGSMPFLCTDKEGLLSGQWAQCRIEVAE